MEENSKESLEDILYRKRNILDLLFQIQLENPNLARMQLGQLIASIFDRALEMSEMKAVINNNPLHQKDFEIFFIDDKLLYKAIKFFAKEEMVKGIIK